MAAPTKLDLTTLSSALTNQGARWQAGATDVAALDAAAQKAMLGAVPSSESAALMAAAAAAPALLATAPAFAPALDWRNKGGNHITPVKNQGGCGSCVSHAVVGVLEAMAHIETGRWVDLSEADSHFCSSHGASCDGWWPDQCLDQAIGRGICDEAGFPFASAFPGNNIWANPPACRVAPNRDARVTKPSARMGLTDPTAVKNHLTNVGPVAGCMDVYQDFFGSLGSQ
ncbi:C1 family peptidase [uncultured Thiodictyon sp.]|uniref:C1 family peptidase n=1 Tax=uncultured Thiodictyon sp. TaxID=1846217 RepID=UPI0025D3A4F9|nr:C1 family peptidase [uncultured Thiodictyon sp.]